MCIVAVLVGLGGGGGGGGGYRIGVEPPGICPWDELPTPKRVYM